MILWGVCFTGVAIAIEGPKYTLIEKLDNEESVFCDAE